MAVSTKNKRKITVGQRQFLWKVAEDDDSADIVLRIYSADGKFIVTYHLGQPERERFLIVLGKEFPGLPNAGGCWLRVLCPQWEQESIITPASVHRLIDWCLNHERELVLVDYKGKPIDASQ